MPKSPDRKMISSKTIAHIMVWVIVLSAGWKLYTYVDNWALIIRDGKSIQRWFAKREKRARYQYVKETEGDVVAYLMEAGDYFNEVGDMFSDGSKNVRKFLKF